MISAQQMEVIARVEQYSNGFLYRHRLGSKFYWSELKTGWKGWYWAVTDETIEQMIERGLAERTNENTVKIKAP